MLDDALKSRLRTWLAERLNAPDLVVQVFEPLSGGSIQENWRLRCSHPNGAVREFVLRKDAPATIASSRTRREEYAIMKAANEAGVLTPEPVGFCEDSAVIGAPFAVMSMVEGVGWVRALPRTCRSAATVWSWQGALAGSWPKSIACGLHTWRSVS